MNIYIIHSLVMHIILFGAISYINTNTTSKNTKKYYIDFISSRQQVITMQNIRKTQSTELPPVSKTNIKKEEVKKNQTPPVKQIEDPDYIYTNTTRLRPSMANENLSIIEKYAENKRESTQTENGFEGIKTDTDFPYPWYITKLRGILWDIWQKQSIVSKNVSAVVRFRIYTNGEIRDIKMEKSSGNNLFDYSVISCIKEITKVDPLPKDYKEDYLTVYVEFKAIE